MPDQATCPEGDAAGRAALTETPNERGEIMRQSIAALALIRRQEEEGRARWLTQWNRKWKAIALVGGHKRPEETFRDCVIRETEEELGLQYGTDFEVAPEPLAHLNYTAFSHSAGEETRYTIELFDVHLTNMTVEEKVSADPQNYWLDPNEIQMGLTSDGKRISPTVALLLDKAGLLTEPESHRRRHAPRGGDPHP